MTAVVGDVWQQTPTEQYPCPGGCGRYLTTANLSCITCWLAANPVPPRVARRLPSNHPRRPAPRPCPECDADLALWPHDRLCPTNRLDWRPAS